MRNHRITELVDWLTYLWPVVALLAFAAGETVFALVVAYR